MKKKLLALCMAALIALSVAPLSAFAASFEGYLSMVDMPQYGYGFDSSYPAPFAGVYRSQACRLYVGGQVAYCIEFGKSTSSGMGYNGGYSWDGLSAAKRQLINYALMFGYRTKTRFAKFYNLPELMSVFKQVADIQTADMLHLTVPKVNFHTEVIKPSGNPAGDDKRAVGTGGKNPWRRRKTEYQTL